MAAVTTLAKAWRAAPVTGATALGQTPLRSRFRPSRPADSLGRFTAGEWHRVIAAYDEAANPSVVTKFVDGIFQDNWTANQGLDNARRALQPTAILFGDGDQDERRVMYVSSIQIRAGKLTDDEMVALGRPSSADIPLTIAVTSAPIPALTTVRSATGLTFSWPVGITGYTLESAPTLTNPTWAAVPGVVNNSVTLTAGSGAAFYRLRK